MPWLLKPFHWIYNIYAIIVFVAIMLLIFPFVIVASFFGRIKGGNMILRLCMLWADLWFFLIFIYVKRIYEAPHDKRKPYLFVANHISYLDSPIIVKAWRQPVRPLGKVEMSKVPLFGFIYRNAFVTVDRSSPENRQQSISILKRIIKRGISVVVFPEGTFSLTPGRCRIVYLDEIPVEGLEVQELKEKVYTAMEKTLLAYKAPWIGSRQDS